MDILFKILAVIALIAGAAECFVGYKSIRKLPLITGFTAGASLGAVIGIFTENHIVSIVMFFLLGIIVSILSYFFRAVGIMCISACYGIAALSLMFENIMPGIIAGLVCLLLTMFFYKAGSIISSALYGSSVIICTAFYIVGSNMLNIFYLCIIIWLIAAFAGGGCQFLTSFYDARGQRNIIDTIKNYYASDSLIERKYPGYQKAYRNYCIKCGYDISDLNGICPRCGFDFNS